MGKVPKKGRTVNDLTGLNILWGPAVVEALKRVGIAHPEVMEKPQFICLLWVQPF